MENQIPKEYRNKFNSFEEFRLYSIEKARKQLERSFNKIEKNGNKDWEKYIKTNISKE